MLRLQLKNGDVYLLDDTGAVVSRSDGPKGFRYSGQWRILGVSTRFNSRDIIPLDQVLNGANIGQGWIHDLDHGTHRLWAHPSGRRMARLDRIPESRPV